MQCDATVLALTLMQCRQAAVATVEQQQEGPNTHKSCLKAMRMLVC